MGALRMLMDRHFDLVEHTGHHRGLYARPAHLSLFLTQSDINVDVRILMAPHVMWILLVYSSICNFVVAQVCIPRFVFFVS